MGRAKDKALTARDRAVKVLIACHDGRRIGQRLLAEIQSAHPLPPNDAALAAELVLGVGRCRITAEHLAARCYRGRWVGLPIATRVVISVAVYQLCWLERIPDHAAIDQAVRQAKRRGRHAAATVNAVLHKVARIRGDVMDRPDDLDPRRYLPIDGARGRLFAEDVFPDPGRRPLEHLIAVRGHPAWLVERWHRRFKPALCRRICDAGQRRPAPAFRANRLRTSAEALYDRFESAGRGPRRVAGSDAIVLPPSTNVVDLPEFAEGLCQPQDATSQVALGLASPKAGDLVLDLCAGAGTKSTQAAELMDNQGMVIASDLRPEQLGKVAANAARLGIDIIRTTRVDDLDAVLAAAGKTPDLILVDAPCTNTGVLARRPEARYRASQRSLGELVEIQRSILDGALGLAGVDTRLIYTTCSLEREENEQQVEWLCEQHAGWKLHRQVFTLPDEDRDGGFAAVLVRS